MHLTDLLYDISAKLDGIFDTEYFAINDTSPNIYGMYKGINFELTFTRPTEKAYRIKLVLESAINEFDKIVKVKDFPDSTLNRPHVLSTWIRKQLHDLTEDYVENVQLPHVSQMRQTLHNPDLTHKNFFLPNRVVREFGYNNLTDLAMMLARCVDNGILEDFHFHDNSATLAGNSFRFVLRGVNAHKALGYRNFRSLVVTWNALPSSQNWLCQHNEEAGTVSLLFKVENL